MTDTISRRAWLGGGVSAALGLGLASCDRLTQSPAVNATLDGAEGLNRRVQGLLAGREGLAREFPVSAISPDFKANGTTSPDSSDYQAMVANGFADWRLQIGGLVERPLSLSLAELRREAERSQITPSRLRRGLERHRPVARREAGTAADAGRPETPGALYRLLLRRHPGAHPRRHGRLLRDHRHRRRLPRTDHPGP